MHHVCAAPSHSTDLPCAVPLPGVYGPSVRAATHPEVHTGTRLYGRPPPPPKAPLSCLGTTRAPSTKRPVKLCTRAHSQSFALCSSNRTRKRRTAHTNSSLLPKALQSPVLEMHKGLVSLPIYLHGYLRRGGGVPRRLSECAGWYFRGGKSTHEVGGERGGVQKGGRVVAMTSE